MAVPRIGWRPAVGQEGSRLLGGADQKALFDEWHDRDGENGCGMTFQPRAVQVVEFVPYEQVDPTDGFDEREGYSSADAIDAEIPF